MAPKIEIHGHRGSRGTHPENTFPSFEEARDSGADAIELDVHLTREGEPIVYHDDSLTDEHVRLSSGEALPEPIAVRLLTVDELEGYDVGSVPQSRFPGQRLEPGLRIPTLAEVLAWKLAEAPRLALNIEIKRGAPDPALLPSPHELARAVHSRLAAADLLGGDTLVQSFDHEVVREFRKLDSRTRLSCLFEHEADFAAVAESYDAQAISVDHALLRPEHVAAARERGLTTLAWTANDPADWRRLRSMRVDGIITDYPRRLRELLGA